MNEELKKRVAAFRVGVISDFVNGRQLQWGDVDRLMQEKCTQRWQIPGSLRTRISESTIKDWIRRYKNSDKKLESLYPSDRSDCGKTRAIDSKTATSLIALRKEMPAVKLPVLMKEAQKRKIIIPEKTVTYSSLHRLLQAEGLLQKIPIDPQDRLRFEAEHPNDLWQCDVMHGPYVTVEGKQRRTYLLCFLDDMTRLICHGEFYLYERMSCYLDSLRHALLKRRIPRKLYLNNNGYSSGRHHLEQICSSLGIVLIHINPYPNDRYGKLEQFFPTIREQLLSGQEITTLESLNDALKNWIDSYNDKVHSITKEAPLKRFNRNIECVKPVPMDLADHFRTEARRTVTKDRTIALDGRLYEAPAALIGKRVKLLYYGHEPTKVEIIYGNKTYGFAVITDFRDFIANGPINSDKDPKSHQ